MATPKAAKKPAPKKKRAPKGLSTIQKDAIDSAEDRNLMSVTQKLKDGKIDHWDSAQVGKGVLDPV